MTPSEPTDDWEVGVVWLTRRLRRPDRMLRDRVGAVRGPRAGSRRTSRAGSTAGDLAEGCASFGDVPVIAGLVAAVVVVGVLVATGPTLFALTIGLLEILLVLLAAIVGVAARVLFGRPWEVVARRGPTTHAWRITGYRRARELVDEIETGLRLGLDPMELAAHRRDPEPPARLATVPQLYRRAEFRVVGRAFGLALGVAIVGLGLVVVVRLS